MLRLTNAFGDDLTQLQTETTDDNSLKLLIEALETTRYTLSELEKSTSQNTVHETVKKE